MAKGGFLSALLAERNSSSTSGFAWRSLYYVWLGIPLLILYYIFFWGVFNSIVVSLELPLFRAFGMEQSHIDGLKAQQAKLREALNAAEKGDLTKVLGDMITYILGALSRTILIDRLFKLGLMSALYHFGVLDLLLQPVYYITKV